ncbi:atlastin-like [Zophobas morio]|uniref:atlastin-like n=1 Tax=Zophobas morio TaxID=2755281 RepID=UPI00308373BB
MQSSNPCALRLVNLDGTRKITTDLQVLQELFLQPQIKDKQVCVVSITGTFRQGKSFLLNFLLRYLDLKYKKKISVDKNWLSVGDSKLTGFEWRSGKERHTVGILIWSEIFLAELPSGEEIAIILLDTQGTFDNKTTKQHCAAVFAISTLISSVQIYNLKNQISQSDLEHMECFSGYGQLIAGQNSSEAPFQNVCFLIRDWQCPYENPYGVRGGRNYLEEFLDAPGQPHELRKQNANIRSLFKKINCFLLPHPGKKVATEISFRGELQDVSSEFVESVEELAPFLLSPENLVPKTVNGQRIKVGDLVHFVQSYCEHFMTGDLPKLESMFLATSAAHHSAVLAEAESQYKASMNSLVEQAEALEEIHLEAQHKLLKAEAVKFFQSKNMMGDDEMKKTCEAKLSQSIENSFVEYRKVNSMKLEKERQRREFGEKLKKTENEFHNKFEQQREKYDNIVEQQQSVISEAQKAQSELQNNVKDLQNQIDDLQRNEGDPILKGIAEIVQGATNVVAGVVTSPFRRLFK